MNRDRQEELERLEKELLAQEDLAEEEETEEAFEEEDFQIGEDPVVYQNFSNNYGKDLRNFASGYQSYNADRVDIDLEEFAGQVQEEKPSAPIWIPILLTVLIGAVVTAILWIFLTLGGLK